MRKILTNFLLIISLFLLGIAAFSQINEKNNPEERYQAINWNYANGLLYGRTTCFIKDIQGFLWVGTQNGLNRFDGNHFTNYLKNQNSSKTILDNHILSLVEDSLHNIWIGTKKGLSRFDILSDSFQVFLAESEGKDKDGIIVPYWSTRDEIFCIESDSIFTSYNIHSLKKKIWASLPKKLFDNSSLPCAILEEKTNSVWILPAGGSLNAHSGLFRYSLQDGKLELFDWKCFLNIPDHWHFTECMSYDKKRNSIWLNNQDGLIQFSLDNRQFYHARTLDNLTGRGIAVSVDRHGRIWMGTEKQGLIIYNPDNGSVKMPFQEDSVQQLLINQGNYRIYCDPLGIVWIGYWPEYPKGITQLIPLSKSAIQYPSGTGKSNSPSSSYGFQLASVAGKIWMFATPGLNIFDPATGTFQFIDEKNITGIPRNTEVTFYNVGRRDGKCLFSQNINGGLFDMDVASKICIAIPVRDKNNMIIPNIQFDKGPVYVNKKIILLTGENSQTVYVLDKDSTEARKLISFPGKKINSISLDGDNYIFIRFNEDPISKSYTFNDGKLIPLRLPTDSITWNKIIYNPTDQSWWAGGYGQLFHYDKDFNLLRKFTQADGIPIINIWGIKPDRLGNIWFNTEVSIAKLTTATGRITLLTEKDGWRSQGFKLIGNDIVNDDQGDLYFYSYVGLDRISPKKLISSYPPSLIYYKSLEVNQNKIPLSTGINNVKELSLAYDENRISIETGIIDYYSKGKSQIRYRLGNSLPWQYGASDFTIHYEGLQPGRYQLIIQASNNANDFNGPERILNIKIRFPWWQTWWAYVIFGALIVFSIWFIIWYRSKTLKERNAQLELKIDQRTKELNLSMVELKGTQAQLVQREKMASLGELTAGIAHEIQNPLNFVNNFSEVNNELLEELREEENKDNRDKQLVEKLLSEIDQNLKKITHHGKRADAIVKGMLQHSRTSTGRKELADINGIIDEYIHLSYQGLRARLSNFQAKIQKDLDKTLGKIKISPEEIGRVLLNLLNNAFYAVTEKRKMLGESFEPTVWVSTKRISNQNTGNAIIEIRVKDNGMGIDQQIKNKIYQPFFTTKPTGEGTGLGLSLSYDIVTKVYGGELKMETKEGEYAEFIICLPA
jgi:signal transduction histidine kinase